VVPEQFDPNVDAARLLALAHRVALAHLRRYPATVRDGWDVDDMTGEAVYYGLTALDRWTPHGGATWQGFAWTRMRGALIDEMRRRGSLTRTELARGVTVDDLPEHRRKPIALDGDDEDYAWNVPDAATSRATAGVDDRMLVADVLRALSAKEREVMVRRYVLDETLVQIGDRLGVTDVQVCHIRTAAFAKIHRWARTRGVFWWGS
jgi:RNA polymerase sigma factor (sigma-70 family)